MSSLRPGDAGAASRRAGAAVIGAILLIVALAAAVSVDVVKAGQGVKGDEATYVAMALSLAYDHDLTYERRDLDPHADRARLPVEQLARRIDADGDVMAHAGGIGVDRRARADAAVRVATALHRA